MKGLQEKKSHSVLHGLYLLAFTFLVALAVLGLGHGGPAFRLAAGWETLLLGLALLFLATLFRRKGQLEVEGGLVSRGPYAVVRHPEFMAHALLLVGLVLLSGSWWSLISAAVLAVLLQLAVREEEQRNRKKFGMSYEAYRTRVPALNPLVGIWRWLRRRKRR